MVITNVKGWIRDLIETHECGFYYDPQDPDTLVRKLQPFLDNRELLLRTQQRARRLAEEQFDIQLQIPRLLKFVELDT
jgi:glycosyltransferase involved in cell wall biosynthesis